MKHARLITVLIFAVMLLILGLLVASVTSCTFSPGAPALAAPTIVRPTPISFIEDGTLYHPYNVDPCPCAVPMDTWKVLTPTGHEQWVLNWLYDVRGGAAYALHPGQYIVYSNAKYHVLAINRKALTMSVDGPLDCCAGQEG